MLRCAALSWVSPCICCSPREDALWLSGRNSHHSPIRLTTLLETVVFVSFLWHGLPDLSIPR